LENDTFNSPICLYDSPFIWSIKKHCKGHIPDPTAKQTSSHYHPYAIGSTTNAQHGGEKSSSSGNNVELIAMVINGKCFITYFIIGLIK